MVKQNKLDDKIMRLMLLSKTKYLDGEFDKKLKDQKIRYMDNLCIVWVVDYINKSLY